MISFIKGYHEGAKDILPVIFKTFQNTEEDTILIPHPLAFGLGPARRPYDWFLQKEIMYCRGWRHFPVTLK